MRGGRGAGDAPGLSPGARAAAPPARRALPAASRRVPGARGGRGRRASTSPSRARDLVPPRRASPFCSACSLEGEQGPGRGRSPHTWLDCARGVSILSSGAHRDIGAAHIPSGRRRAGGGTIEMDHPRALMSEASKAAADQAIAQAKAREDAGLPRYPLLPRGRNARRVPRPPAQNGGPVPPAHPRRHTKKARMRPGSPSSLYPPPAAPTGLTRSTTTGRGGRVSSSSTWCSSS